MPMHVIVVKSISSLVMLKKCLNLPSLDICGTTYGDCCQINDMTNENINFNPGWIDQFSEEYLQG
jgi:hypothetical protein